jgi:hypothetical protein
MNKSIFAPLFKVVLVSAMAVAFVFSSFTGIAGAEGKQVAASSAASPFSKMLADFNEKTDLVNKKEELKLIKLAKKHLKNDGVLTSLKLSDLDFNNTIVRILDNGDYFVKVSKKGSNDVEKFNGVSITFNQDNKATSTLEVSLKMTSDETAALKTWVNGDKVTDVQFSKPDVQPQWSWSYFNDCLASQGVAWATIAALGFLCGAACVFTAGTACVVCLYAGSSLSGGTIGWCIGQALNH